MDYLDGTLPSLGGVFVSPSHHDNLTSHIPDHQLSRRPKMNPVGIAPGPTFSNRISLPPLASVS